MFSHLNTLKGLAKIYLAQSENFLQYGPHWWGGSLNIEVATVWAAIALESSKGSKLWQLFLLYMNLALGNLRRE